MALHLQQRVSKLLGRKHSLDSKGNRSCSTHPEVEDDIASSSNKNSYPPLSPRSPYTFDLGRRSSGSTTISSPRSPLFSASVPDGGRAMGWDEDADEDERPRSRIPASIAAAFFDKRTTVNSDCSLPGKSSSEPNEAIDQPGAEYTFPSKSESSQDQANLRPVLETRESLSTTSTSESNVNEPRSHFSDWGTSIAPIDSVVSLSLQIPSNPTASSADLSQLLPRSSALRSSEAQEFWKSRSTTDLHIAPFPPHSQDLLDSTLPSPTESTLPPLDKGTKGESRPRRFSVPANIRSSLRRSQVYDSSEPGIETRPGGSHRLLGGREQSLEVEFA